MMNTCGYCWGGHGCDLPAGHVGAPGTCQCIDYWWDDYGTEHQGLCSTPSDYPDLTPWWVGPVPTVVGMIMFEAEDGLLTPDPERYNEDPGWQRRPV